MVRVAGDDGNEHAFLMGDGLLVDLDASRDAGRLVFHDMAKAMSPRHHLRFTVKDRSDLGSVEGVLRVGATARQKVPGDLQLFANPIERVRREFTSRAQNPGLAASIENNDLDAGVAQRIGKLFS